MKPRTLLILLLVVAGLGAFIWFYERDLPSSEERSQQARKLLGGLDADEVVAVAIDGPGGRVRLERAAAGGEGAGAAGDESDAGEQSEAEAGEADPGEPAPEPEWWIAEPAALAAARADRFAVERLLDKLTGFDKVRTLGEPDRTALGLEEPRARVTLVAAGGEETTIELGAEVPASSTMLVGLAGRPEAWVVDGSLTGELGRAPGEWRDREVFHLRRDQVDRLTLAPAGGATVVLARRGPSFWIDEPFVDRADAEAVEGLLTDLVGLRAVRFVDEPAAGGVDRGLEPPRAVIEARAAAGEPLRLEFGAAATSDDSTPAGAGPGTYFARIGSAGREPQVITASAPLLDSVSQGVEAWQSRALTGRRLYQIDRVRIEEPGGAGADLLLRRDGADWRRGEDEIPYSPVSDLLFAVTDARAERLLRRQAAAAAGADLAEPTLRLTFEGGDEAGGETIALYPPTAGGEIPATVTGRDFVLFLAPSTAESLSDSLRRLREAEPIPEDEAAVDDGIDIAVEEGDD